MKASKKSYHTKKGRDKKKNKKRIVTKRGRLYFVAVFAVAEALHYVLATQTEKQITIRNVVYFIDTDEISVTDYDPVSVTQFLTTKDTLIAGIKQGMRVQFDEDPITHLFDFQNVPIRAQTQWLKDYPDIEGFLNAEIPMEDVEREEDDCEGPKVPPATREKIDQIIAKIKHLLYINPEGLSKAELYSMCYISAKGDQKLARMTFDLFMKELEYCQDLGLFEIEQQQENVILRPHPTFCKYTRALFSDTFSVLSPQELAYVQNRIKALKQIGQLAPDDPQITEILMSFYK